MESLKPFDEITEPDERNTFFIHRDEHGNTHPQTVESRYKKIAEIQLNTTVPDEIKSHFAQALNLSLYSWFHYQFHVTSEFMSLVTIEFALRKRFNDDRNTPLKKLLSRVIREGLLKDEFFSITTGKNNKEFSYVNQLITAYPDLRNIYAHGTNILHPNSVSSLQIAADFINQLYPNENE